MNLQVESIIRKADAGDEEGSQSVGVKAESGAAKPGVDGNRLRRRTRTGKHKNEGVPRDEVAMGHLLKEVARWGNLAKASISYEHGIVGEDVWLGHFEEQLLGVVRSAKEEVEILPAEIQRCRDSRRQVVGREDLAADRGIGGGGPVEVSPSSPHENAQSLLQIN
ncbi:hypothetical protein HPP92_022334 [Vanilla planifolia]|uniref:Uncharacterized protein n=1 Tax=Vanilla planifolia TaxID=51239 RepID=A0A835UH48_VANPL|nr:hypothetical protein HPP92_022334 [Vanilla planifolia]